MKTQIIEMFSCQTSTKSHIILGTDHRIAIHPLAKRVREDQIKQSTSKAVDIDENEVYVIYNVTKIKVPVLLSIGLIFLNLQINGVGLRTLLEKESL
ncbi:unnamed protein product [Lactuca saligna]|uniref:Uncharacterized protein n=1 Tax=Lactuca saligna TaxID=75948 RepID=A0AA35YM06_LACSI|nr:unnamed protein product [Lactuca saligna]